MYLIVYKYQYLVINNLDTKCNDLRVWLKLQVENKQKPLQISIAKGWILYMYMYMCVCMSMCMCRCVCVCVVHTWAWAGVCVCVRQSEIVYNVPPIQNSDDK